MRFCSSYVYALLAIIQLHFTLLKGADVCGNDKVAENQLILQTNNTIAILTKDYFRATCAWKITAPPGYNVAITISNDYWTGDGCDKQNLKLYDGASPLDKLLAEFCKTKPRLRSRPIKFFSSDVNARLELKTGINSSSNLVLVAFTVKAVKKPKQACTNGIVFKLAASSTVSTFTNPYYPLGYQQNASCAWLIEAPPGKLVKLSFTDIGVACFGDVITVYDGDSDNAEDLFKNSCSFLENFEFENNDVIYSYGQKLYVSFKTDDELQSSKAGFKAVYSAIDGGKECIPGSSSQANVIKSATPTGTISSPGFPTSIPNEPFTCTWRMKAPEGQVVKLNLDTINLKYRRIQDYLPCKRSLKVFSGIGPESYEVISVMCDDLLYDTIASTGRRLEIVYSQSSKHTERPKGFSMDYVTIPLVKTGNCGANREGTIQLTGDAATFNSPHYPSYVPANMTCRWNITVTTGQVVELYTDTWTFNYDADKDCNKEYVRIYDGPTTASPVLAKVCPYKRKHFFSSSNRVLVEFVTSGKTNSKGFSTRYAARIAAPKPYACSDTSRRPEKLTTSGKLASHRFPLMYSNNARCSWKLEAPFGYFVNFTLSSLDLESDSTCSKDFLLIRSEGWKLAKLCGNKKTPVSYLSKDNEMSLIFWADATGRYRGFEGAFNIVKDHSFGNCTQQFKNNIIPLTSPSGTIFSPRYPNYYPNNMLCTWIIKAPKDHFVRLSFNHVRLQACDSASIEIRDKASNNKVVGRLCKYPNTPFIIFSSGSGLVVEFKSLGDKYTNMGFTADYEIIPQLPQSISCGQHSRLNKLEDSSSGSIASYEYPLKYQNNVKCMWTIKTSSSYRFKIKFDFLDIEPSPDCKDDYVVIRDGGYVFSDSLGQFCGSKKPDSLTSSESAIFVEFKTNGTGKYPGFKLSYERTFNVRTIVLIAVFSTIGGIGVICLLGWLILVCCSCVDDDTETTETMNLQQVPADEAEE